MNAVQSRPPLTRPRSVVLGGVCAALADHLGWHVASVRILMTLLAVLGGGGILLYLWLWALVPLRDPGETGVRRAAPVAVILLAVAVTTVVLTVAQLFAPVADVAPALVGVGLSAGGAVAWSLAFDRSDPDRTAASGRILRGVASVLLLASGAATLLARPSALSAVLAVTLVILGIGVLAAPRVVALWTDLLAERATRVREEQRADIAAHLHDSVLQTLALIQNRAGASSEVARIARAQERELRDWLFAADAAQAQDLTAELNAIAAAIELDWPARIEVVTVGESGGAANPALVGAAREAMLNAARHAGGEVSVYVEQSADAADIFIRDRGAGVELDSLPNDRLGIRESIIGRMSRAGGSASVRPGVGGSGTEVHLRLEHAS